MSLDIEVAQMVRDSAQRYAERYSAYFKQLEDASGQTCPHELLEEAERLGWADHLAFDVTTSDPAAAQLLGTILLEIARHSPAIAARFMSHHLAQSCCRQDEPLPLCLNEPPASAWFGLSAAILDHRLEPTLSLLEPPSGQGLAGTLGFVIAGDTASYCVGPIRTADGDLGLALIACDRAKARLPVTTLGLHGLGAVDLVLDQVDQADFRLLARGVDALDRIAQAGRLAAISYLHITLAMLESAQRIASEHTAIRRQNGRLLRDIPAVHSMLTCIDQAVGLTQLGVCACSDPTQPIGRLLGAVHEAALAATDCGLQALGGVGYMADLDMERLWRDARQLGQYCVPKTWK